MIFLLGENDQVLLVAGGQDGNYANLASTEVLSSLTAKRWTLKAPLPYRMHSLRGVTLNNTILMTGMIQTAMLHTVKPNPIVSSTYFRRVYFWVLSALRHHHPV